MTPKEIAISFLQLAGFGKVDEAFHTYTAPEFVLGICYIKLKKRLWILILAHAYMDTLLMVQLYLASN